MTGQPMPRYPGAGTNISLVRPLNRCFNDVLRPAILGPFFEGGRNQGALASLTDLYEGVCRFRFYAAGRVRLDGEYYLKRFAW